MRTIKVMDSIPDGWKVVSGANAPRGYRLINNNNKSRFGGEYRVALVPEEVAYEWCDRTRQADGESAE